MLDININVGVNINSDINININHPNPFTGRHFSSFLYSIFCNFPLQIMRYDISLRHKKNAPRLPSVVRYESTNCSHCFNTG